MEGKNGIEKDDEEEGPENEKEECKPFHRNHFGSINLNQVKERPELRQWREAGVVACAARDCC